jgi:hypothetical protein
MYFLKSLEAENHEDLVKGLPSNFTRGVYHKERLFKEMFNRRDKSF